MSSLRPSTPHRDEWSAQTCTALPRLQPRGSNERQTRVWNSWDWVGHVLWWSCTFWSRGTQCAYPMHLSGGGRFIVNNWKKKQLQIQEEEAAVHTFCVYYQHLDQKMALPFPWVWGMGVLGTAVPISTMHICSGLHPLSTVFPKGSAGFLISKLSPVEHQGHSPPGLGREEEELHSTGVFVLPSDSIYKLLRVSAETTVDCGLFCFLNIWTNTF